MVIREEEEENPNSNRDIISKGPNKYVDSNANVQSPPLKGPSKIAQVTKPNSLIFDNINFKTP